jgi:hypothetical protein
MPMPSSTYYNSESYDGVDLSSKKPDGEPFVRYTIADEGLIQTPLRPIDEPAPKGAIFESLGVYFVTDSERNWLEKGRPSRNVQHQCRQDGRVFYRVVAESDALEGGIEATDVSEWLAAFADDYLGIEDYQLYFSGNRSIHLETDRFVDADGWQSLKELVRAFNRETSGDLDTAIYSSLPQWRRIGVEHRKTGLSKVPIDADDTRSELVSKAISADTDTVLEQTYVNDVTIVDTESLSAEIGDRLLRPHINPPSADETDDRTEPDKPVSPYALTGEGQRSLILFRPFTNPCERTDGDLYSFGKVIEAIGADGEFTRSDSFCDVLLSAKDVRKWSVEPGDYVAIIGGRSFDSKLIDVDEDDLSIARQIMIEDGKQAAIDELDRLGYDVGESRRVDSQYSPENPNNRTEAASIKRAIEAGDREPDYDGIFRVSCRLLRLRGWRETVEWIEGVYGDRFDPSRTHAHLSTIVEAYPESFDVDQPDEPIDPSVASETAI